MKLKSGSDKKSDAITEISDQENPYFDSSVGTLPCKNQNPIGEGGRWRAVFSSKKETISPNIDSTTLKRFPGQVPRKGTLWMANSKIDLIARSRSRPVTFLIDSSVLVSMFYTFKPIGRSRSRSLLFWFPWSRSWLQPNATKKHQFIRFWSRSWPQSRFQRFSQKNKINS